MSWHHPVAKLSNTHPLLADAHMHLSKAQGLAHILGNPWQFLSPGGSDLQGFYLHGNKL